MVDSMPIQENRKSSLSNLILFLYQTDIAIVRHYSYYCGLLLIFFSELYSIMIITQASPPKDTLLQIFWEIVQYSNINVVASRFNSEFIGVGLLVISILFDLMLFYYSFSLAQTQPNSSGNILVKKKVAITFVWSFCEIQKWVLFIPKIDLAMGSIFCLSPQNSILQNRCSNNSNFTILPDMIYYILGFISLFFTIISSLFASFIYINIDFQKKNPLKFQGNFEDTISYLILLLIVLFSYIPISGSLIVTYFMALLFSALMIKDYFYNFPMLGKSIIWIYGNFIFSYFIGGGLILLRDRMQSNFSDSSHFLLFLILSSIFSGCNFVFLNTFNFQRYGSNLKFNYSNPKKACQYLSELCDMLNKSMKDNQSWLVLMGMLEVINILILILTLFISSQLHQTECDDQYCPCQEGSIFLNLSEQEVREKKKHFLQVSIEQGSAIPPQGVWLSELRKDFIEFKLWMEDFIEYHFYQIVEYQGKNKQSKADLYSYIYFWSFEIYGIKNYVKALYLMKQHYSNIRTKSRFFLTVENCVSMLIESLIKERDKSLIYSNKQSDIQDANLVRKFSNLFHSEFQVIKYKQTLSEIIISKINICEKLINSYSSLSTFGKDIKTIVKKTDELDKKLRVSLLLDLENVHYLKMLSLINQVIYCYPQQSSDYEGRLSDITARDRGLEKDIIHSIQIINGNVASIVMSYKTQKCQLEKYSNRTPSFFGYSSEEFKAIKTPEPLIPDIISLYHNYYVGRIIREGNPKILRRYRTLVAKKKNGFLFPIKLFVDYFFNIHDSLCFSALVLRLETNCEYILVEHDGYIQGFSEGFYLYLRETSQCLNLDPNLLMQANIKIIFPTLLEFLSKYDENKITPNMSNHFRMEIPMRLNDYIREFLLRKNQLDKETDNSPSKKKLDFVKKLVFYFIKLTSNYFQEQTTVYDVQMRITKDFLSLNKDNLIIQQNLFILEISNMSVSKTLQMYNKIQKEVMTGDKQKHFSSDMTSNSYQQDNSHLASLIQPKKEEGIKQEPQNNNDKEILGQQNSALADNKMQNLVKQVTLNKYSNSLLQNEQRGPASISIRRQRSNNDSILEFIDQHHTESDVIVDDQKMKKLKEGYDGIIAEMVNQGTLNKEKGLNTPKVDYENDKKEFEKFCSLTSYVNQKQSSQTVKEDKQIIEDEGEGEEISEVEKSGEEGNYLQKEGNKQGESSFDPIKKGEEKIMNMKSYAMTSKNEKSKSAKVIEQGKITNSQEESGTLINQNVRKIGKIATDKSAPVFIRNLYIMFSFQWSVFIIISIVSCLNYVTNFQAFKNSIDVMSFTSTLFQGLLRSVLSLNYLFLSDLSLMDYSSNLFHKQLLTHTLHRGYFDFQQTLIQSLQWPLSYPSLSYFQNSQQSIDFIILLIYSFFYRMDFTIWTTETQELVTYQNIPIPSCLKKMGQSIFQLIQNQNSTYVNFATYLRELVINQSSLMTNLDNTINQVITFIKDDKSSFQQINIAVLLTGLVLILCSFALIFKSLLVLQTQEKKILGLISRISEEDALSMISLMEAAKECVSPSNQDYLTINLRVFEEKNVFEKKQNEVLKKIKHKRIKSNYLNDRIAVNNLNNSYSFIIITFLLLISIATLLLGFIIFQLLIDNFDEPLGYNFDFLTSFSDYSDSIQNFDALITNAVYKVKTSSSTGILTKTQEQEMKQHLSSQIISLKNYYNDGYSRLSSSSISSSFSDFITQINQKNSCALTTQVFDDIELAGCSTAKSGLMNKGLVPEMNSILEFISGASSSVIENSSSLLFFIEEQDYLEEMNVAILVVNILNQIKEMLNSNINSELNNYGNLTIILFICGSVGYSIFLIAGFSYFYITSFRDFQFLRRGVILMPYSRLACDNHTMNLLNNTLQIKQ